MFIGISKWLYQKTLFLKTNSLIFIQGKKQKAKDCIEGIQNFVETKNKDCIEGIQNFVGTTKEHLKNIVKASTLVYPITDLRHRNIP